MCHFHCRLNPFAFWMTRSLSISSMTCWQCEIWRHSETGSGYWGEKKKKTGTIFQSQFFLRILALLSCALTHWRKAPCCIPTNWQHRSQCDYTGWRLRALRPSTVNHSLCWRSGGVVSQVLFIWQRFLPPEKENKCWSASPRSSSQWASQRPPGGCPAAPAPWTRMFGLENDFASPSALFSNCPKGNYLVSFPLKKNQEPWRYYIQYVCSKSTWLIFL